MFSKNHNNGTERYKNGAARIGAINDASAATPPKIMRKGIDQITKIFTIIDIGEYEENEIKKNGTDAACADRVVERSSNRKKFFMVLKN